MLTGIGHCRVHAAMAEQRGHAADVLALEKGCRRKGVAQPVRRRITQPRRAFVIALVVKVCGGVLKPFGDDFM